MQGQNHFKFIIFKSLLFAEEFFFLLC